MATEAQHRQLQLAVTAASLLLLALASAGAATETTDKRLVKERRADGTLVLDESGLTAGFELMLKATRSIAELETPRGSIVLHAPRIPTMGPDWLATDALARGSGSGVLQLQTAAPLKLRTEVDLAFEGAAVPRGNITPGFAGLYSLWLVKLSDGTWHLTFNSQPDVWGSMHDATADVAQTSLDYELGDGTRPLELSANERAGQAGVFDLAIVWGPHRWSTSFRVVE